MNKKNYTVGGAVLGIVIFAIIIFVNYCEVIFEKTGVCLPIVCTAANSETLIQNGTAQDGSPIYFGNAQKTCDLLLTL